MVAGTLLARRSAGRRPLAALRSDIQAKKTRMHQRPVEPASFADASSLCDSGAQVPHPWGDAVQAFEFDDRPWHADPWQTMDADYRRWQQVRYRQLADEFERADKT
jgi:hypothetical protein